MSDELTAARERIAELDAECDRRRLTSVALNLRTEAAEARLRAVEQANRVARDLLEQSQVETKRLRAIAQEALDILETGPADLELAAKSVPRAALSAAAPGTGPSNQKITVVCGCCGGTLMYKRVANTITTIHDCCSRYGSHESSDRYSKPDPDAATGTADDQVAPAVVDAIRKHIDASGLSPQGFADAMNALTPEQIKAAQPDAMLERARRVNAAMLDLATMDEEEGVLAREFHAIQRETAEVIAQLVDGWQRDWAEDAVSDAAMDRCLDKVAAKIRAKYATTEGK